MQEKKHHFKIIATGSSGNSYLINNDLLLDAGASVKKIRQASNFSVPNVLITHEHQDHSKSIKSLLDYGAKIYMTQGTQIALGVTDVNINIIRENQTYKIDNYKITPFKSYHDAIEPVNYQIQVDDLKILYITDTADIPYNFDDITHLLLEINYTTNKMIYNMTNNPKEYPYYKRATETHLSDTTAINWLKNQDLSKLQELYIIHTSENNCDLKELKNKLQELKTPYKIAKEHLCL